MLLLLLLVVYLCAELFMCHKQELMEQFYSQTGRAHRALNPQRRHPSIPSEILTPDDVIIPHDDDLLDEGVSSLSRIVHTLPFVADL